MNLHTQYQNKNGFNLKIVNNQIKLFNCLPIEKINKNILIDNDNNLYYLEKENFILLEKQDVLIFQQKYKKKIINSSEILRITNKYKSKETIDKHLNNIELKIIKEEKILLEIKYSFKTKKEKYYINKKIFQYNNKENCNQIDLFKNFLNDYVYKININKTKYYLQFHFIQIKILINLFKQYNITETIFKLDMEGLSDYTSYEDSIEKYYKISKQNIKIFCKLDTKHKSFRISNNLYTRHIMYLIESIDSKYKNEINKIFDFFYNIESYDNKSNSFSIMLQDLGHIYSFYKNYKINPKHILNYIYNSIYISQCVGNIARCIEEYSIYLMNLGEYANIFNIKPDKTLLYPKHLLSEKRKLSTLVIREEEKDININIKKNQEQNFIKYKIEELNNNNDKLYFNIPKSIQDLIKGANKLNNCLKGYSEELSKNSSFILYVYKKNNLNELYGAIEIENDNKINQTKIKNNEQMEKKYIDILKNHLDSNNLLKVC